MRLPCPTILPAFAGPDEVGEDLILVEFHDIDLTAMGPSTAPCGPNGWPETFKCLESCADFISPELPFVLADGDERARSVFSHAAAFPPIRRIFFVVRIRYLLFSGFDDEKPALAPGVGGLVPLKLLVTGKTLLGSPNGRIRWTVMIEFVRPNELVCRIPRRFHRLFGTGDHQTGDQEGKNKALHFRTMVMPQ